MALDPSIALGVRPIELPNQLAQYAQMQQIQGFQQANELNQLKMQEAQAAMEERNALRQLNPANTDYENQLFKVNPTLGIQYRKERTAAEAQAATAAQQKVNAAETKQKMLGQAWRDISGRPSDANIIAHLEDIQASPLYDAQEKASIKAKADSLLAIPLAERKPYLEKIGSTSSDYTSRANNAATVAATLRGQDLTNTLAREKFNWEKANPGFELKETESGEIVGVNKRTLQAFPVTVGGAAPMAGGAMAPAGSQPNAAAPSGIVPQAGVPLKGKAPSLTETQSNATAYGMRMKEANAILEDLAKKGVVKGAIIERTPLIGGVLGQALPGFLGGTSEAQQQVNQAKSNFITAVLRKESGAVISDSEFDREDKKYFPQINDSEKVIKQKENARKLAIDAIGIQAGPGAKNIRDLQPSVGNSSTDPLGLMRR